MRFLSRRAGGTCARGSAVRDPTRARGTLQHLPAPCAQVEAGHTQVLGGFRPARLPLRSLQGLHLIALVPANLLMGSIFRGFDNNRKVSPTPGGRQMGRSGKQLWGWGKQLWGWGKEPQGWGLGLVNVQARAGGSEDQSEFRILPARWPAPSSLWEPPMMTLPQGLCVQLPGHLSFLPPSLHPYISPSLHPSLCPSTQEQQRVGGSGRSPHGGAGSVGLSGPGGFVGHGRGAGRVRSRTGAGGSALTDLLQGGHGTRLSKSACSGGPIAPSVGGGDGMPCQLRRCHLHESPGTGRHPPLAR